MVFSRSSTTLAEQTAPSSLSASTGVNQAAAIAMLNTRTYTSNHVRNTRRQSIERSGLFEVERWGLHEVVLKGPNDIGSDSQAFEIMLNATFVHDLGGHPPLVIRGFFDGEDIYKLRFSPPIEGRWTYTTQSSASLLHGRTGAVRVMPALAGIHGPVEAHGFGLFHADGSAHHSIGTTAYAWTSQPLAMQQQTLETLRQTQVFNKIRMSPFPKRYQYNNANPVEAGTPYEIRPHSAAADPTVWSCVGPHCPPTNGSFHLRRFNVTYWRNLERRIDELRSMDVVADLILFHPYDHGHWGFDCMGGSDPSTYNTVNDEFYLTYAAARLAAFSNVWWSMANEWSYVECKAKGINSSQRTMPTLADPSPAPIWDRLFANLHAQDPYGRMTSIHNAELLYDYGQPWVSHVSLQGIMTGVRWDAEGNGYAQRLKAATAALRGRYGKPIVWDEAWYEGNMPCTNETGSGCLWGALSGEAMAQRFWHGASVGAYVGHGETLAADPRVLLHDFDTPLWWAKGGQLLGTSPSMIHWFSDVWTAVMRETTTDFATLVPGSLGGSDSGSRTPTMLTDPTGNFVFAHLPIVGQWKLPLPSGALSWHVGRINVTSSSWSNSSLPPSAEHADIECNLPPCNVMFFRSSPSSPP